jgi:hypothetical protein
VSRSGVPVDDDLLQTTLQKILASANLLLTFVEERLPNSDLHVKGRKTLEVGK